MHCDPLLLLSMLKIKICMTACVRTSSCRKMGANRSILRLTSLSRSPSHLILRKSIILSCTRFCGFSHSRFFMASRIRSSLGSNGAHGPFLLFAKQNDRALIIIDKLLLRKHPNAGHARARNFVPLSSRPCTFSCAY